MAKVMFIIKYFLLHRDYNLNDIISWNDSHTQALLNKSFTLLLITIKSFNLKVPTTDNNISI